MVVCANGAETPRLLLMSASAQFPHGLANSSGLVGKYLMFNYSGARARRVRARVERIQERAGHAHRARLLRFGSEARLLRRRRPRCAHRTAADDVGDSHRRPRVPSWGSAYKARLQEFPRTHAGRRATARRCALESNNVTLDPELKDAWGLPAIRVTYKDHPDDLANARFLQDRGAEILEAAGALRVDESAGDRADFSVHLLGTCRMGNDPATSVVDKYHRSHDVPNLFVCDGSSLVTSGRGQPTMTIQALAFRAGEHIARFAKRGEI